MIKTERAADHEATGEQALANLIESLAQKVASNEPFDLDAICRRHPDCRERLRDLVVVIRAMTRLAGDVGDNNRFDQSARPAR